MKFRKSVFKIFVICSLLLCSAFKGFAQTASTSILIRGQLLQGEKKEKGAYFLIGLYDTSDHKIKGTITDSLGYFFFTQIPSSQYKIGLQDARNNIVFIGSVEPSKSDSINLGQLQIPDNFTYLKEVVINSSRPLIQRKLDKLIVNIANSSVLAGNTLAEILPKLPGIRLNARQEITINGKADILVLIDGKGQYVAKEQLDVLLNNYKAEDIDKIEIISNPSAKYDANGGAVINIITNQKKMISDVHQSIGQQIDPVKGALNDNKVNYAIGTVLNLGFKKIKTFTSLDYTYKQDYQENNDNLVYSTSKQTRELHSSTNGTSSAVNARFGFNADLSPKTSFDGTISLNKPFTRQYARIYESSYLSPGLDSTINATGLDNYDKYHNNTVNLRLSQVLREELNREVLYSLDLNDFYFLIDQNTFSTLTTNQSNIPDYQGSTRDFKISIYSLKSDYTTNFKNGVLETGGKFSWIKNNNGFNVESKRNNITSVSISDFNYHETVGAGYVNYIKHYKKLDIQMGVRAEVTSSSGVTSLLAKEINKEYINLFPSVAFQYSAGEKGKHQFSLTYNKRIVRPGFSDFNPNRYLPDRFSSNIGNPGLEPEFVHSGEFSYLVNGMNFTTFLSYTKDSKVNILEKTSASIDGLGRVFNLSSMQSTGLNASVPIKFTNKWTSFNSINIDYTRSSLLSGENTSYLNYTINSNQNFQLTKRLKADLNLFYLPETRFDYGKLHEVISVSAGLKMTALNNKVSLTLNMNDILGRNMYQTISQYPSVQRESISLRNERFYRLTARYNFKTGKAFSIRNKRSKNDNSEVRLN